MMPAETRAGRRSALPGILAGVLLVYMIMLGGSEVGVFLVPFQVINASLGAVLVATWIWWLGRGADTVDGLSIGALLLFVLACAASTYPRQSFDAATAALTWTAVFGVGRRLLADPRYRMLCFRLLGICAALLAVAFAVTWGSVWLDWIQLAGRVPPLDLNLPQRIYRHYYVVAMLLAALAPAVAYLIGDRLLRVPAALTLVVLIALAGLSGSRTVWLALGITGIASLAFLRPPRRVVLGLTAAALVVVAAGLVAGLVGPALDRLVTSGTVSYRLDIWRYAAGIWFAHPWTGLGPGSIGIGLALSDLTDVYSFVNRHADNMIIQVAAEGGVLGLLAGALAIAAVVVGRATGAPGSRVAIVGLVLVAGLGLTNNPMDSPNLVALAIAYVALTAPYAGSTFRSPVRGWRLPALHRATWAAACVVAAAVAAVNVAAVARSSDAGVERLAFASAVDPGMALYHRELAVALAGHDPSRALREIGKAVALNPADTAAMRFEAVLRASMGDAAGAALSARRAIEVRPIAAENWLVLAMVAPDQLTAADAVVETLRVAPWLSGSPAWPAELSSLDVEASLDAAAARSLAVPVPRGVMSLAWLRGVTGSGHPIPDGPAFVGLQQVLSCNLDAARATYSAMGSKWALTTPGIIGRLMLARLVDDPQIDDLIRLASLSQPDLANAAKGQVAPYSAFSDPGETQQLYRRSGINARSGGGIIPRTGDALAAWMLAPGDAAGRTAGRGEGGCR